MTKENNTSGEVKNKNKANTETPKNDFSQLFEDVLKTNPQQILILSLDENNNMNFNTNFPDYQSIIYTLNRASFEVILHEKSSQMEQAKAA